ncbi:hypothetical protein [Okeania sp.]|uniref:hypothetical protein n=1 Tax=Okeania sp. TaxID=3100323 RepID=UPI002B4AC386|nr:hypothetical protein [Okeania sp.]MEB3343461.1 hypothetical protein [Okeania sp.]
MLEELLLLEYENPEYLKTLDSVLKSNIDKLNYSFSQLLQKWISDTCSQANLEEKEAILAMVESLCLEIFQFPGEKLSNFLEIVIVGLETILRFRTRDTFPKKRAEILNFLAHAYRERIRGNKAENIEQEITCLNHALKTYAQKKHL